MNNKEKYINAFIVALELEEGTNIEEYKIGSSENWDSVGHMTLITQLEDDFDIMFETEDIIDFDSFNKGIEILGKYGIKI